MTLREDLLSALAEVKNDRLVAQDFRDRLEHGALTRDENTATHFCVYFLPYNPKEKKVFLVAHKKSGLWLSPGGHIDKDELLVQALNREISEELGLANQFAARPHPLMFSTVVIDRATHPCKKHYDTWFLLETDGLAFKVDPGEFHETRWVTRDEALALLTDESNIQAIKKVLH